jgi:hypothetical protein
MSEQKFEDIIVNQGLNNLLMQDYYPSVNKFTLTD